MARTYTEATMELWRARLFGFSIRGDCYLRTLLIRDDFIENGGNERLLSEPPRYLLPSLFRNHARNSRTFALNFLHLDSTS